MIIEENPIVHFNDLIKRGEGISAYMQTKNGQDYLKDTILSIIDQVDEIICVFNNSIDNTEQILVELEQTYPEKIKVYKYVPEVHPQNSQKYLDTHENSVHSFSYYSNFALSKTTKKYCIKVDDDEIFFPNSLTNLKNIIEKEGDTFAIGIRGINIFDYKNKLYVNLSDEYTDGYDTFLYKYNKKYKFFKTQRYESFVTPYIKNVSVVFYHTKRCKKDRGINNYLLNDNPKSRYNEMSMNFFNNLNLVNIERYIDGTSLIDPSVLNFKYINNSNKSYDFKLLNTYEDEIENKLAETKN
jgi:glycosyltransferase involved in cell wall biosynthesis